MAWAVGPSFASKFPNFTRSANAGRWWECAESGKIRDHGLDGTPNPGVIPRNKANKLCFENAAGVVANGESLSILHWPNRYVNPLVRRDEDSPPLEPPGTIAEAFEAAEASRLALQDDARRETFRELAGGDELQEPDPDETTVNDPPRRS